MDQEIDPTQALTDLDALTLVSWRIAGNAEADNVVATLRLTGGLGRVTQPDGSPLVVDPVGTVNIERELPEIEDDEIAVMSNLLERWNDIGLPLRVLEFPDFLLVVEDGENYLRLPRE